MTRFWKQLSLAVLLGFVLSGTAVLAHPDHKVLGTVTMVAADHVMVKDRTGKEHTIKLVKTTKVLSAAPMSSARSCRWQRSMFARMPAERCPKGLSPQFRLSRTTWTGSGN